MDVTTTMTAAVPDVPFDNDPAHEAARRDAWLARRREHITSSDVPAIMGLPGAFGTPMQVFLEKKSLLEKGEAPAYLEAGLRLQPVILNWYADRRKVAIQHEDPYDLVVCPDHPFLAASLDARWYDIAGRRATICVDAKNVRIANPEEWGEEGSDEIPGRYVVQLHVQMLCTEQPYFAELAALFGGADPRWFKVAYDPEIAAGILEAARNFMEKHVLADVPPPVDGSDDWTRWLNSRPARYADYAEADEDVLVYVRQMRKLQHAEKVVENRLNLAKNHIRAFIGERSGLITPYGKIHYKRNKDGENFAADGYESEIEKRLRALDPSFDPAAERKRFTTTKPGARPLLPKLKE